MRMIGMTVNVVRREGYLALYSGLSASLCRQVKKNKHTLNPSLTVRVLAAHIQMDFFSFTFFLDDIFFDTVRHL